MDYKSKRTTRAGQWFFFLLMLSILIWAFLEEGFTLYGVLLIIAMTYGFISVMYGDEKKEVSHWQFRARWALIVIWIGSSLFIVITRGVRNNLLLLFLILLLIYLAIRDLLSSDPNDDLTQIFNMQLFPRILYEEIFSYFYVFIVVIPALIGSFVPMIIVLELFPSTGIYNLDLGIALLASFIGFAIGGIAGLRLLDRYKVDEWMEQFNPFSER